jgi:hypothetical protein
MTETTNPPRTVLDAILAVMGDVGVIRKDSKNEIQGFKFRGIDDVMNALHAPMIKHRLVITFRVLERTWETRTTKQGGTMNVTHLLVEYTFHGPGGDFVTTTAPGEAQDSGDKATNKALSAAFKYALLHTFCIPTQDMEDADGSHEEATPVRKRVPANAPVARTREDGYVSPHAPTANATAVVVPSRAVAQKLSAIKSAAEQLGWTAAQVRAQAGSMGLPERSTDMSEQQAGQLLAELEARLGELAAI